MEAWMASFENTALDPHYLAFAIPVIFILWLVLKDK